MSRGPSRASGRPTLAELARIAGVSPITASRALRGVTNVDPELARRVREAAVAIDYVANSAARTLASARSDAVVVLIPSLSNLLFIDALESIHAVMNRRALEVLIGNYHYSVDEEHSLVRNYLAYQPRGLILTGFEQSEATRQLLSASRMPSVHMMDLKRQQGVVCAGFSQQEAGGAVARHLLARGRCRLAYVAAQLDARTLERGEGFRAAIAAASAAAPPIEVAVPEPSSVRLGGELFAGLMEAHPEVDGIFFCNDDLAHGALFEAARRDIPIPGRVAVVGFNDLPISAHMVPRLSSVRTPRAEVGRVAAEQLLQLIDGETVKEAVIDLGFALIERESS